MLMKRSLKELMQPKFKRATRLQLSYPILDIKTTFVECIYHFDKPNSKYSLFYVAKIVMILRISMMLSSKKVDTQYISGTRETIVENICRIVHQAATVESENGVRYFTDHFGRTLRI